MIGTGEREEEEEERESDDLDSEADEAGEEKEREREISVMETEKEALGDWQGMRSVSQLRKELLIPQVINKDSVYKPVERVERVFRKLLIPKKLQAALPFASKPKLLQPKNKNTYMSQRAVILEPKDRKKRSIIDRLNTITKEKREKKIKSGKERFEVKKRKLNEVKSKFEEVHKESKKRKYALDGVREREKKKRG